MDDLKSTPESSLRENPEKESSPSFAPYSPDPPHPARQSLDQLKSLAEPAEHAPDSSAEASKEESLVSVRELRGWVRDIFFAALTAILIVIFVVQPVKVEGTSMEPKLEDQERIFVNKFIYHFSQIERGDIVVFWYPKDPTKSFIKRVIGVPGERVEIRRGQVHIDGQRLDEPYVPANFLDAASYPPTIVPEGHFYVLGDHRNSSNDSRNWGSVPSENIFGKAVFRYWPVSKLGLLE